MLIKTIKFLIWYIIIQIPLFFWVFAQPNRLWFEESAEFAGIDIAWIKAKSTISRYEVARILNAVECKDCINPWWEYINYYTSDFWGEFAQLPWKDFDDINYQWWWYNWKSYYYCVASVADKQYMFWYPLLSSPICPGLFCGSNSMTKAEFVQVVINILSQYIFKNYSTNRSKIKAWTESLSNDSYQMSILQQDDLERIDQLARSCNGECAIKNSKEFHTYLKYCMFNLNECGMTPVGWITQGYWPISEINIAKKEWIITDTNDIADTIHRPIDWNYAISVLWRVYPKISCIFDTDYDCDGISNKKDNCPNTYNPNQNDIDNDSIGDVCDSDIDWDWITNPKGIIDAWWNMNTFLWTSGIDNCVSIANKDQKDSNNNNLWDKCDLSSKWWLAIESRLLWTGSNRNLLLTMISSGIINKPLRTISYNNNTTTYYWTTIVYPINEQWGIYKIHLISQDDNSQYAEQSLIIDRYNKQTKDTAIILSSSKQFLPSIVYAHLESKADWDTIEWQLNGPEKKFEELKKDQKFSNIIRLPWSYTITASIKKWNSINWVAQQSFIVNDDSILFDNIIIDKTIKKDIPFSLSSNSKISERSVDRWDGQKSNGFSKTISHTYTKYGHFVISATITLQDRTKIGNTRTVSIIDNDNNNITPIANIRPIMLHSFTTTPIEWANIIKIWDKEKNQSLYFDGKNKRSSKSDDLLFSIPGIYYPKGTYIIDQCKVVENQSTVIIEDKNLLSCMELKRRNLPPECDMDKDWIDDRCDDDIDGDGVKNLIWVIQKNDIGSCKILPNNIDSNKLSQHFQWSCSLDNCPRTINKDQKDIDKDYIGDVCKTLFWSWQQYNTKEIKEELSDRDGDGILDNEDKCPELKESYNGFQDTDGCPELWSENPCQTTILSNNISIGDCRQCPCQYAEAGVDLKPWDTIRSTLRNTWWNILQSRSNEERIQ